VALATANVSSVLPSSKTTMHRKRAVNPIDCAKELCESSWATMTTVNALALTNI